MADISSFRAGQTIQLSDGRICVIRFVGPAHFSSGDWIGVELSDGSGKNDGSVQGERYFDCEPGNGMFLRPAGVSQIVAEPPKPATKPKTNGVSTKSRPSSGVAPVTRRASVQDAAVQKRVSVGGLGSAAAGRTGLTNGRKITSPVRSPIKSPTKSIESVSAPRAESGAARRASSITSKPPTNRAPRISMGPPSTQPSGATRAPKAVPSFSRPSVSAGPRLAGARTSLKSEQNFGRQSISPLKSAPAQASEEDREDLQEDGGSGTSPPSPRPPDSAELPSTKSTSPILSRTSAASASVSALGTARRGSSISSVGPSSTRSTGATALNREVEDLKTKLRMMEKRRMEDREKLKVMEKLQTERDKFEAVIQKLQQKYQPQQQEMAELRRQLKEAKDRKEAVSSDHAEHEMMLEMATLDREMAEEQAESFRTELEALKLKTEELELEVEILREENQELGNEMSPEEKTSKGWLQMERNNERLREALLRLRDVTQQQEEDLREQVKGLEEDVQELSTFKQQYEETRDRLVQTEASSDDLRQQLEAALGAEEMIEELTEKNMNMSEKMEELRAAVEDLESLKELNDELEVNHIETEKQLQEEIDYKDNIIYEHSRKSVQQEETMADYETTVTRFRELVNTLQGDLEQMRTSQQMTENEAEELNSRSRAIMELNMKLQVSASKTQVKTLDLELRRMEAQEASDHLAIVQLFLPDTYHQGKDSVLAFLRFKRISFKANLLQNFIKDRVGGGPLTAGHEDSIFAACDALDKLTWVTAMCDRFVTAQSSCSPEQFSKFESALYEVEPVERALNGWIDNIKRDELQEKSCADELSRTIAVLTHLAEIHVPQGTLEADAEESHMQALLIQSHLESSASALFHIKSMTQVKLVPTLRTIPEDEESTPTPDHDEEVHVFAMRIETLISHIRSSKVVVGKTVRALDDLKSRSLALDHDHIPAFSSAEDAANSFATYIRNLGTALCTLFGEEGRERPVSFSEIDSTLSNVRFISSSTGEVGGTDPFQILNTALRSLTNVLLDLGALTSDLPSFSEFTKPVSPWITLSKAQKASPSATANIEAALSKAQSALSARTNDLALRNQALDEATVKIELLESRTRDFTAKASRITSLEEEVLSAKKRETDTASALENSDNQLRVLEVERDHLVVELEKRRAMANTNDAETLRKDSLRSKASEAEVSTLKADLKAAQDAISYLRRSASSATTLSSSESWLSVPLTQSASTSPEDTLRANTSSLLRKEASDSLASLLDLVSSTRPVKLRARANPIDWRAWRPVKESTRFAVARQTEDWEQWREWAGDVGGRWREYGQLNNRGAVPGEVRKGGKEVARIGLRSYGLGKENVGLPVKIVQPEQWEEIEGALRS